MPSPFVRHEANPLLTVDALDHAGVLVFNPGVCRFAGRWYMAYRCDDGTPGDPNIVATSIHFATSDDGLSWTTVADGVLDRPRAIEMLQQLEPHQPIADQLWRIYDPRLTVLRDADSAPGGGLLALTFAADTTHGLRPGLATSHVADDWKLVALGAPDGRNHVLLPEQVDGRWWRLERPMHEYGGVGMGAGRYGIWASASPDLRHWGDTRFVLGPESLGAEGQDPPAKIGPGTSPIRTPAGWLSLIHVVFEDCDGADRGWEPSWTKRYEAWTLLTDLEDPSKVVACRGPALAAEAPYETTGFRNDVIFPTAAVITGERGVETLRVYYGAADTCIAMAHAPLADVIDWTLAAD